MPITTTTTIKQLRSRLKKHRVSQKIALVPTMGNLHAGHIALVKAAAKKNDLVVATVFVNPLQFGENEDFDDYPRTLDEDTKKLHAAGVHVLFAPKTDEIYAATDDPKVLVTVPELAGTLCGAGRPGHFDGVSTIVTKLFNIIQPNSAYFGEKDWQQLVVIKTMAHALNMPIKVVGVPTIREPNGLALSSRNQYLSASELEVAPILFQTLRDITHAIGSGARNYRSLEQTGRRVLKQAGFEPEYVAVRDARTLAEPNDGTAALRVLAAAKLGKARLIDNVGAEL